MTLRYRLTNLTLNQDHDCRHLKNPETGGISGILYPVLNILSLDELNIFGNMSTPHQNTGASRAEKVDINTEVHIDIFEPFSLSIRCAVQLYGLRFSCLDLWIELVECWSGVSLLPYLDLIVHLQIKAAFHVLPCILVHADDSRSKRKAKASSI